MPLPPPPEPGGGSVGGCVIIGGYIGWKIPGGSGSFTQLYCTWMLLEVSAVSLKSRVLSDVEL